MGLYLITGGCGFIGSHLADHLLHQGHRVRVLDDLSSGFLSNLPDGVDFRLGTITDRDAVAEAMADVDGCFHLAAIASVARSVEDWAGTHRVNLTGTVNVLDTARAQRLPVAYASSAAVYGDVPAPRLTEDLGPRPLTAYGADKLGCELHARVAGQIHGIPTCGLRFFNVFGPRQDPHSPYSGVISIFADRIHARQPLTINGDGEQCRDFIYVGDVVRHLGAALAHASPEAPVFNVCTGRAVTIKRLAETMMEVAGTRVPVSHGPSRPGDIRHSVGNPSGAVAALGLHAAVTLTEGLRLTLRSLDQKRSKEGLRHGTEPVKVAGER